MIETQDIEPIIRVLFFMTTILFILSIIIFSGIYIRLKNENRRLTNELKEKEELLKKKKDDSKALFVPYDMEKSKSIVVSVNKNHEITYINNYGLEFFDFSKDELLNKDVFSTIYKKNNTQESLEDNIIDRIFKNPNLYVEHESENLKKNGTKVWISWTNRVVYDDDMNPLEIRSVGFDISKRKKLESTLHSISSIDTATGVLNRQAFLEEAVNELKRANRYNRSLTILLMKLDCFNQPLEKSSFTDEALKEIIELAKKVLKETDIIGRLGDIEFAILLPETAMENAQFLGEQLKIKIQEKGLSAQDKFFVNVDFGIASRNKKEESIDSLLQRALDSLEQFQKTEKKLLKKKGKGE